MNRLWTGMMVMALFTFCWGKSESKKIFPFEYEKLKLDNGLTAYFIHAGGPGQIAYVSVVRTGSREEWEEGRTGYAHFFEHMMFRGTRKYPAFDRVLTPLGASVNAFTGSDLTTYYIVASSDSLEQVIDLESDRFMNLAYSESEFRTEAGAVLGEFNQGHSDPFFYLFETLRDTAFHKHTYKHLPIGFEEDVRRMPEGYDYSRSFFDRYYRPGNVVLLLVGDFDTGQAAQLIREYYGPWKPGYVAPRIEPEPPQSGPLKAAVEFPGQTLPMFALAYKGPAWSASKRLSVAATVLGEIAFGQNSSIYRRLVIEEQELQELYADFDLLRDPYLLSIYGMALQQEQLDSVLESLVEVSKQFRDELCDQGMLEDTKSALRYDFLMKLETAQDIAFALLEFVVYSGGIEAVEDYFSTLQSITAEDVRQAARKYLVEDHRTTVKLLQGENR